MLLALMYHRVGLGKHANTYEMLKEHLVFLKEHYSLVLPGEALVKRKLSVCLTFDDASYDFYHYVFPLLQELKIRVLLGVPVEYILESTIVEPEKRLAVPYPLMMQEGIFETQAPFCTWQELEKMLRSGYVEIASHSYRHCNLTFKFVDLEREIVHSKNILQDRLPQAITSFIYPFGRVNPEVHKHVSEHYPYAFRIGSALNWGWGKGKNPLCRVSGDQLSHPNAPVSLGKLTRYFFNTLVN